MAKWKNALLISTIVAPIAFGASPLGDAFAQADRPGKNGTTAATDVQINKMVKSDATGTGSQNFWWNDGSDATSTMTANGFHLATRGTYTFKAYQLPDSAIKGFEADGEPKISTDYAPYLKAVEVDVADTPNFAPNNNVSKWTIELKVDTSVGQTVDGQTADLLAQIKADSAAAVAGGGSELAVKEKTTNAGIANFSGADALANGNWIVVEDSATVATSEKALPMVLHLPMQMTGGGWFGTGADSTFKLYPKNYESLGDLKVQKVDPETGDIVKAAGFQAAIFQLEDQQTVSAVETALKADYNGKTFYELDDATKKSTIEAIVTGLDVEKDAAVATDSDGVVNFSGLNPEGTYYVIEWAAPAGYLPNGAVQHVILQNEDSYKDDQTVGNGSDADDDVNVYYTGSTYSLNNYDDTDVDKKINTTGTIDPNTADPTTIAQFVDQDEDHGAARGQVFQYSLQTELNKDIGNYKSYVVNDSVPYQANINSFVIGFNTDDMNDGTDETSTYTPLIKVDSESSDTSIDNGGDTGHGWYYDTDLTADGDGSEKTPFGGTKAATFSFADGALQWFIDNVGDVNGITPSAATAQQYIQALIRVSGQTSTYEFDSKAQAIEGTPENGNISISLKEDLRKALGNELPDDGGSLVTTMDAQLNAAAQVGWVNNTLTLHANNGFKNTTDSDNSKTFSAGWEFLKTDGDDKQLAGAGFDLKRLVTETDASIIEKNLLGGTNLGKAVTPDNAALMAQAIQDSKQSLNATLETTLFEAKDAYNADKSEDNGKALQTALTAVLAAQATEISTGDFVYFSHLSMDSDMQPVLTMPGAGMDNEAPMGDIFWTAYEALATTHTTGDEGDTDAGYFQYCGLPAGKYVLTETVVPSGYSKIADVPFSLGNPDADGTSGDDAYPFLKDEAGDILGTDNTITGAAKILADENPDKGYIHLRNYEKSIFPLVGGLGTLFAVIAGLLAMGLALLKRKKDMKNEA